MNKKQSTMILISLISLAVIAVLVFSIMGWVNNGKLSIKYSGESEVEVIYYCPGLEFCNTPTETKSTSLTLPKGDYSFRVEVKNNTSYTAQTKVEGFMKETVMEVVSKKYKVDVARSFTSRYYIPSKSGYITYRPGEGVRTNRQETFNFEAASIAQRVGEDEFIIVEYYEPQDSIEITQRVYYYNYSTGEQRVIGTTSGVYYENSFPTQKGINSVRGSDSNYIATTITKNGVTKKEIPAAIQPAKNGNNPIIAFNENSYAILVGNDYVGEGDGNESRGGGESFIKLYDSNLGIKKVIPVGTRSDISNLSFSPSGKTLAVIGEYSIQTFDVQTGDSLGATEAVNLGGDTMVWVDDDSYIYQYGVSDLYLSNIKTKSSYSLIDNSLLRITSVSGVFDGKVYLTAFSNSPNNSYKTSPDAYVVDLGIEKTNTPPVPENAIVRSLPYSGSDYSIQYTYDNDDNLIIEIVGNKNSYQLAVAAIKKLGFNPADYNITFRGYINPFGGN